MNIFIDIETIPAQPEADSKALIAATIKAPAAMKKAETIDDWHNGNGKYAGEKAALIEEQYRRTSFDGAKGEIISIAWAAGEDEVRCSFRELTGNEGDVLQEAFDGIHDACNGRPPFFIGHYISGFDLRFLFHRAVILSIRPPFSLPFNGRHNKDFFDTNTAWAGFRDRISQDNLCKALGIDGKPSDIDGSKVWDFVKAGQVARVAEYNVDDVEKNRRIYRRLSFS